MGARVSLLAALTALGVLVAGLCSAVAMGAEGCPNEALRTELGSGLLPDCRAYEMISPPYKQGYPMFASSFSADGEKAVVYGLGNLAGTQGAGESVLQGEVYLDSRTIKAGNSPR